jgi:hypothetical protein
MSETPLYDNLMRQHKTIMKRFGENAGRDKEIFFSFVEKLKAKYPRCHINFNVKQRNNKTKTLKSRPFENSSKMYYAIFKATEIRCSQTGGRRTRRTRKQRRE